MIYLDTNILIEYLKSNQIVIDFIYQQPKVEVSFVVAGELLQGVRNKADQKRTFKFLNTFKIDKGSHQISTVSLRLIRDYYLSHNISFFDAIIAATALVNKAPLVTLNTKHFQQINGLEVINPLEI